jgi:membrane protein implicated in regulation of membrane protease activity
MNARLIIAIITSLLDEAIIVGLILWGLPKLGINIPLWGMILAVIAFAIFAVISFRIGSRVLKRKAMTGFVDMIGMEGKTTTRLMPDGYMKIEGEIWQARAQTGAIQAGKEVSVTGQQGMKLIVQETTSKATPPGDLPEKKV